MGNGGQWMNAPGYQTTHVPTEHSALSFSPGQADADPTYGHIAFVEQVDVYKRQHFSFVFLPITCIYF